MVGDHDPLFVQRPACTHQATLGECNQACLHGRESCQVAPVDQNASGFGVDGCKSFPHVG
ncbi:unnamed protein product [Brassica oleracea var. botrytis]